MRKGWWQAVGVAAAVMGAAAVGRAHDPDQTGMPPPGPFGGIEEPSPEMVDRLDERLGFSEDQRTQMREVVERYRGRFNELQARTQRELEELGRQLEGELKALMTPAQRAMMNDVDAMHPHPPEGSRDGGPWSWQPEQDHDERPGGPGDSDGDRYKGFRVITPE